MRRIKRRAGCDKEKQMRRSFCALSTVFLMLMLAACAKQENREPVSAAPAPEGAAAPAAQTPPAQTPPAPPSSLTSSAPSQPVVKSEAPPAAGVAAPAPVQAPAGAKSASAAAARPAAPAGPTLIEVPAGTDVTIILTDPISTGKNKAGDIFTASLAEPLVINGATVAARGATVKGRVIQAEGSGRVKGTASIQLGLTSIVSGGKTYPIATRTYDADAETTKKRDAGLIAGGGGVGAAIGALAGGKKGAAKGAIFGTAAGAAGVLATKGKEVELDSESRLTFSLSKAVDLPRLR
jgi:hypothetical protein